MKTGKYTLREFFSNTDLYSIIIPEIQRDYVWGKEQIIRLLDSIRDDYSKFNETNPISSIDSVNQEIVDSFNQYYRKHYLSSNIGFIYAYSDADYPGYYFLIDGQQRFTTIFLTLLVLSVKLPGDHIERFNRIYTYGEANSKPKLDYRVREASHRFLCKLVESIDKDISSTWIKEQSWYLNEYINDTTIQNIVDNLDVISGYLEEKELVDCRFKEYIEDYLEFWYFDTNISEQGEELYIYMNARGEFMQAHENLKADLIAKLSSDQKKDYGKKWEEWQDLFWKNKGNNSNADKGFNEFLCCIAGLENFAKEEDRKMFIKPNEHIPYDYIKDLLSVEIIEKYYNALKSLFEEENISKFKEPYTNVVGSTDWIGKAKNEFWDLLNNEETNWLADPEDNNRGTERNRMVYIWSMLHYLIRFQNNNNNEWIYKTLRLFYVRYHNYDRAVKTTLDSIKKLNDNGIWNDDFLNDGEEKAKYSFLKGKESSFEAWIWKIEDHPLNLDGRDVGNINCSHLVDFEKYSTIEELSKIYKKFCLIFPLDKDKKPSDNNTLLNSLLFTAFDMEGKPAFWDVDGPGYYTRLNFSSYKRIVRGKSNRGDNKVFDTYFNSCLCNNIQVTKQQVDIENAMQNIEVNGNNNIIYALCWYAAAKGVRIWNKGNFLSFNHQYEEESHKQDKMFNKITSLCNMKGDFRGNDSFCYLQDIE